METQAPLDLVYHRLFRQPLGFSLDLADYASLSTLTLAPATALFAICPLLLFRYQDEREIVSSGKLLWAKLVSTTALIAIELLNMTVYASPSLNLFEFPLRQSSSSFLASICLCAIIYFLHMRTFRSSTVLSTWLIVAATCDLTRARISSLSVKSNNVVALAQASALLKMILLVLEELPKKRDIALSHERQSVRWQSTCGLLTRNLIIWPYEELSFGFRNIERIEQLDQLDPEYSAERLAERFSGHWASVEKTSHCLTKSCVYTLLPSIVGTTICRLVVIVFHVAQPICIYYVMCFLESAEMAPNEGFRIVVAAVTIFLGQSISKAASAHSERRLSTLFWVILTTAIHKKSLKKLSPESKNSPSLALIRTNLETAIEKILWLFQASGAFIEIGIYIYLIMLLQGITCVFLFLPGILSHLIGRRISKSLSTANKAWGDRAEIRKSETSKILSQIKAIRAIGIDSAAYEQIEQLHRNEISASATTRFYMVLQLLSVGVAHTFLGPILITSRWLWNPQSGQPALYSLLITTSLSTQLQTTLFRITSSTTYINDFLQNISKIQDYLLSEEVPSSRESTVITEHGLGVALAHTDSRVIEFSNVFLAPWGISNPVLVRILLRLDRGGTLMVAGPRKCGKTTFLLSLLRESKVLQGSVYIIPGLVTYCGQVPWICNSSIRYNIVGDSVFDTIWYNRILEACCLESDLEKLHDHDETSAGIGGSNLSEEIRHKISIARALYPRPVMVVIDDIFGSLDLPTANEVFSRLFKPGGLVRRSGITAVIATRSIPYLQTADRVLLIEANGTSALYAYSSEPAYHQRLAKLVNQIEADSQTMKGNTLEDAIRGKGGEAVYTTVFQQQDLLSHWQTFLLYLQSFPLVLLLACVVLALVSAVTELGGATYVYVLIDTNSLSSLSYAGYWVFSSSTVWTSTVCLYLWFSKAVPFSANRLHRRLLKASLYRKFEYLTTPYNTRVLHLFQKDLSPISGVLADQFIRMCYIFSSSAFHLTTIVISTSVPLITTSSVVVALLTILWNHVRVSRNTRQMRHEATTSLYNHITETEAGLCHIRSFQWQDQRTRQLYRLVDRYQRSDYYTRSLSGWLSLCTNLICFVLEMMVISLAIRTSHSSLAAAVAVSLLSLMEVGEENVMLIRIFTILDEKFESLARIGEFIKSASLETEGFNNFELPDVWPRNGKVLFEKVSVWHKKRNDIIPPVLSNVTVYIPGGWKVGIVGRPGSGKTSLILALLGFLDYSGRIVIDGVDISKVPRQLLRERIITITQDSIDLDGTVRSCLDPWGLYNGPRAGQAPTDDQIEKVLRRLKLWVKISENGGLDGKVSDMKFTSDQRKMMCIARACIHKLSLGTRLVVVDDAMADFHPDQDKIARRAMKEFMSDCTILMVAHRMESLRNVRMTIQMIFESAKVRIHQPQEEDEVSRDRERDRELPPAMKDYGPVEEIPAELEEIVRLSEQGEERPREEEDAGLGASSRQQRQ